MSLLRLRRKMLTKKVGLTQGAGTMGMSGASVISAIMRSLRDRTTARSFCRLSYQYRNRHWFRFILRCAIYVSTVWYVVDKLSNGPCVW